MLWCSGVFRALRSDLLVQRGLQVQRFVWHQELSGGFGCGLRTRFLRGVLYLPDHQTHRVPAATEDWLMMFQLRFMIYPRPFFAAAAALISLSFIIHLFLFATVMMRLQLTHFYLLWIFSSRFSAQKAFTSKSTPQAWEQQHLQFKPNLLPDKRHCSEGPVGKRRSQPSPYPPVLAAGWQSMAGSEESGNRTMKH